ncbi:hypothetical protein VNO78_00871 [Psophocarpus tetragonolobus]|uniref:Uncharacterized protein n=1 Tax=Psophocarpus tetragonolobus TaxID=3891 RepID=A0AAN9T104_PSOTE
MVEKAKRKGVQNSASIAIIMYKKKLCRSRVTDLWRTILQSDRDDEIKTRRKERGSCQSLSRNVNLAADQVVEKQPEQQYNEE